MKIRTIVQGSAAASVAQSLLWGFLLFSACASDPPPPAATPAPPTASETMAPTASGVDAGAPAVADQAPAAAEPECQAGDDCKKLREPAAGLQWTCENARCLEQPVPEPAKAEATAEPAKAEKVSKKGKGKPGTKK